MTHSSTTSLRFSRAATSYDAGSNIQQKTAARLIRSLPDSIPPHSHVVDIGCGTGLLTKRLASLHPALKITAVDPAAGMIRHAIRQHQNLKQVLWHMGSADTWHPATPVDWVISNAALHWATDLPSTFFNLHNMLKPGGRMHVTLMIDGTLKELHDSRAASVPHLPPRKRMPSLMELDTAVRSAGFIIEDLSVQPYTVDAESAAHLLQSLHRQGLTGGPLSQGDRLLTRGELRDLTAYYNEHFSNTQGGVTATYETVLLTARRP